MRGEYSPPCHASSNSLELPPRARRIPLLRSGVASSTGTTSACAENTERKMIERNVTWNYLRVRGEYASHAPRDQNAAELPPRARRIQRAFRTFAQALGTTSACAENTVFPRLAWARSGNYLRVRGEYWCDAPRAGMCQELPPRARRIQWKPKTTTKNYGTTSACAENTFDGAVVPPRGRNYLRVRGEYCSTSSIMCHTVELPPRARRILFQSVPGGFNNGTTSACAENTLIPAPKASHAGNYLRVRGEYLLLLCPLEDPGELPPRARRIRRGIIFP